jgi:hypothetical protein
MTYTYGESRLAKARAAEDLMSIISEQQRAMEVEEVRARTDEAQARVRLYRKREAVAKAKTSELAAQQRAALARARNLELQAELLEAANSNLKVEVATTTDPFEAARKVQAWASARFPEDHATGQARLLALTKAAKGARLSGTSRTVRARQVAA